MRVISVKFAGGRYGSVVEPNIFEMGNVRKQAIDASVGRRVEGGGFGGLGARQVRWRGRSLGCERSHLMASNVAVTV